ncbi:MAG: hypothetical protein EOM03_12960 [Clostridia bacterium]|nr:hypothetical protein [Clostridia bacterium]
MFRGLPVIFEDGYSGLQESLLETIKERFEISINSFGSSAEAIRLDFQEGTDAKDLQELFERVQRKARELGSKVHYVIVAEKKSSDDAHHWHGVILADSEVWDVVPTIDATWHSHGNRPPIIWTRNRGLPGRFPIGRSEADYLAAFKAASYLAKTSQAPDKVPGQYNRITSRQTKQEHKQC